MTSPDVFGMNLIPGGSVKSALPYCTIRSVIPFDEHKEMNSGVTARSVNAGKRVEPMVISRVVEGIAMDREEGERR